MYEITGTTKQSPSKDIVKKLKHRHMFIQVFSFIFVVFYTTLQQSTPDHPNENKN